MFSHRAALSQSRPSEELGSTAPRKLLLAFTYEDEDEDEWKRCCSEVLNDYMNATVCCLYLSADAAGRVRLRRFTGRSLNRVRDDVRNRSVLGLRTRPPVVPERSRQREVPPAVAAGVRLLPRVDPGVPPQLARSHERLVALRAAVGFFSRVSPHVRRQRPLLSERLAAVGAVVRRDAGVQALVSHERAGQGEPFVAEGALVGPLSRVSPLMIPQLGRRVAALLAVRTRELLPREAGDHLGVHRLQVRLQVPVSGEALQADGAVVRPLAGVRTPVQPELALAGESLLAESARERLLPRVDPFVDHEQPLLREPLLAHGAGEGPLSRVSA